MTRLGSFLGYRAVVPAALVFVSCLPKDTRPTPARLDVTATADPLLLGGAASATTTDGWSVSYERFLISVGSSLDGETSCASYYNDGYQRVLDMGGAGPQKVNTLFGLGHCDFGFRVESPDPFPQPPVGAGVRPADFARMVTPGTDPYTVDEEGLVLPSGVSLYVLGSATKDAVTKRFEWTFRRALRFRQCAAPFPGDAGTPLAALDASIPLDASVPRGPIGLDLASNEVTAVDIRVHGEAIFLDSAEVFGGAMRFDTFAAADDHYGDGDGDVTLAELREVPLTDIATHRRYVETAAALAGAPPGTEAWKTLEDFVYLGLLPRIARFEDRGTCDLRARHD